MADDDAKRSKDAQRRRRAERLLGELLPDQTRDESGESWGERGDSRDEEFRRDVPPHHGS